MRTGVTYKEHKTNKYISKSEYKGKLYYLGSYRTEREAHNTWKLFKSDPELYIELMEDCQLPPGFRFVENTPNYIRISGKYQNKKYHLGFFSDIDEAWIVYWQFIANPEGWLKINEATRTKQRYLTGVSRTNSGPNPYRAQRSYKNKKYHLGQYPTEKEAYEVGNLFMSDPELYLTLMDECKSRR